MRHEPSAFCKVATPAYHARSLLPWNWASTRDFAELLKAQAVNLEAGAFRFCVCTFSLYPTNLTHMAGTRFRNNPVLLKPDGKTITKPFATTTLGLEGRERVLFIGTQFSILYTSMYSPAEAATPRA